MIVEPSDLQGIVNNAAKTVKNLNCDTISYFYNAKDIFKNAKTKLIDISKKSDKLIVQQAAAFFEELNKLTGSELNFTNMLINNISFLENNNSVYVNINVASNDYSQQDTPIKADKAQLLQNLKTDKQNLEKIKYLLSELQDIYSESSENKIKEIKLNENYNGGLNRQTDYSANITADNGLLAFYIKRNTLLNALNKELKIDSGITELIDVNSAEIMEYNAKIIKSTANKFLKRD